MLCNDMLSEVEIGPKVHNMCSKMPIGKDNFARLITFSCFSCHRQCLSEVAGETKMMGFCWGITG